ncbi:MAG TPA: ATPase, T2SS/T4P/T4SS family [bacterium]|nr:ATPase, T2SS/T4P/T4SS family [bacterium]
MIHRVWPAVGLILFVALPSPFADVIYLKSGEKIEGVVRDRGGREIEIETAGGIFSFQRDAVARVEASSPFANLLTKARSEKIRQNYTEAIQLYTKALQAAQTPEEKSEAQKQYEDSIKRFIASFSTHDPLTQGLKDIQDIETVKRQISDPRLLSMLQSARLQLDNQVVRAHYEEGKRLELRQEYRAAIERYKVILDKYASHPLAQNIQATLSGLYLKWGESEYLRHKAVTPEAQEAFLGLLEHSPNHPKALYYLGILAMDEKNYAQAVRYFSQVDESALSTPESRRLSTLLARAQESLQPKPTPVRYVPPPPPPEPEPEPSRTEKIRGWFAGMLASGREFIENLTQGTGNALSQFTSLFQYFLIGLGVLIVFWYIPMKILYKDLPNRRVIYYNWRKIVRYTGLLGLLLYFIDRWRREEPKKRCPACNRSIDNPDLFENYDFSVCPFCNVQIKPPFTLPEIIQSEALYMARNRALSDNPHDMAQREQMLNFLYLIMVYGKKIRASDIHLEPEEQRLLVRYRVDGVLTESIPVEGGLNSLLVSCVKVVCNLNIAERRLPQDGHFRRVILGEEVNIRVSTIPTRLGEKVVLRLLDKHIVKAPLDRLGMRAEVLEKYRQVISSSHGLILATGPTGSGKTTLQYASLQYLNDGTKNIITVEDPIEYELEGINQVQHNTATGLTFATALRSILRQDPDIIMVGEIRDLETASISVNASLTGHLVFSTLHTIDTSNALSRLIDLGVDVKLLSSAILCIVAQRLVRKLCPHCKKQTTASAREIHLLGKDGKLLKGQPIFRPRGCRECLNTGYLGRTGVYEILFPTPEIRELTEKGASNMDIRQASLRTGMKTIREEGVLKVLAGITSIEEVLRVTTEDITAKDESRELELPVASESPEPERASDF